MWRDYEYAIILSSIFDLSTWVFSVGWCGPGHSVHCFLELLGEDCHSTLVKVSVILSDAYLRLSIFEGLLVAYGVSILGPFFQKET